MLLLVTGATIYVPRRLARLFELRRAEALYILFAAGTVSIPASMGLIRKASNDVMEIYYFLSTAWMGFFLYILLLLLCFHVLGLFLKLPQKKYGIVVVFLAVLVSAYALWHAYGFSVVHVEVPIKGLKEEVKITILADIHLGAHRKGGYLEEIVMATNKLKPDFVLIPGDIADSNSALTEETFSPLLKLKAPAYFTTGNHDTYVDLERLLEILEKSNIKILHNQVVRIHGVQLIGLDYMNADEQVTYFHPSKDKRTIKTVLPTLNISSELPAVLMHHSPVGIQYVHKRGIDLMLSGHTHGGGQIFPITVIANLRFPYKNGLFDYKGTSLYVSQGAGTYGPPMRFGTTNEITLIHLKKGDVGSKTIKHRRH